MALRATYGAATTKSGRRRSNGLGGKHARSATAPPVARRRTARGRGPASDSAGDLLASSQQHRSIWSVQQIEGNHMQRRVRRASHGMPNLKQVFPSKPCSTRNGDPPLLAGEGRGESASHRTAHSFVLLCLLLRLDVWIVTTRCCISACSASSTWSQQIECDSRPPSSTPAQRDGTPRNVTFPHGACAGHAPPSARAALAATSSRMRFTTAGCGARVHQAADRQPDHRRPRTTGHTFR